MKLSDVLQSLPKAMKAEVNEMFAAGASEAEILAMLEQREMASGFDQVRGTQYASKEADIAKQQRGKAPATLGVRG